MCPYSTFSMLLRAAAPRTQPLPPGDCESGGLVGMRAAGVGAPMLCLCTTLGQDGLTARLLVVRGERLERRSELARNRDGSESAGIIVARQRVSLGACRAGRFVVRGGDG